MREYPWKFGNLSQKYFTHVVLIVLTHLWFFGVLCGWVKIQYAWLRWRMNRKRIKHDFYSFANLLLFGPRLATCLQSTHYLQPNISTFRLTAKRWVPVVRLWYADYSILSSRGLSTPLLIILQFYEPRASQFIRLSVFLRRVLYEPFMCYLLRGSNNTVDALYDTEKRAAKIGLGKKGGNRLGSATYIVQPCDHSYWAHESHILHHREQVGCA